MSWLSAFVSVRSNYIGAVADTHIDHADLSQTAIARDIHSPDQNIDSAAGFGGVLADRETSR
jgi:hypothetical protein